MLKSIRSYLPVVFVCIALLLALIAVVIFAPAWAGVAASIALLISSAIATFSVVQKQMRLYRERPTSRVKLVLKVLFEILGILLAMAFAGLLGRYIAQLGIAQISNDLIKVIAGITIALLAGMGVGFLVNRTWELLVKTSPEG